MPQEATAKDILSDHYEAKAILALTAATSFIALGIILGAAFFPKAYTLTAVAIVPLGISLALYARHRDLEKLHDIEYKKFLDMMIGIAGFLKGARRKKINYLLEYGKMDESKYDSVKGYLEIVKNAKRAGKIINNHCSNELLLLGVLAKFRIAQHKICGLSTEKRVKVIAYENNKRVLKEATIHPYSSVFAQENTRLVFRQV